MASSDSPRARASASATARTKAGSLRFPRWGTGARYGPSVSTSRRSGGQAVRRSVIVQDRKSTRLNSSHGYISYAVFCLKKKNEQDAKEGNKPQRAELYRIPMHLL